jgi:hypothetical protein
VLRSATCQLPGPNARGKSGSGLKTTEVGEPRKLGKRSSTPVVFAAVFGSCSKTRCGQGAVMLLPPGPHPKCSTGQTSRLVQVPKLSYYYCCSHNRVHLQWQQQLDQTRFSERFNLHSRLLDHGHLLRQAIQSQIACNHLSDVASDHNQQGRGLSHTRPGVCLCGGYSDVHTAPALSQA